MADPLVPAVPPAEIAGQGWPCRVDFFARHTTGPCACPGAPIVHELPDGTHFQHRPETSGMCEHCAETAEAQERESGEPPAAVEDSDPVRAALVTAYEALDVAQQRARDQLSAANRAAREAQEQFDAITRRRNFVANALDTYPREG